MEFDKKDLLGMCEINNVPYFITDIVPLCDESGNPIPGIGLFITESFEGGVENVSTTVYMPPTFILAEQVKKTTYWSDYDLVRLGYPNSILCFPRMIGRSLTDLERDVMDESLS